MVDAWVYDADRLPGEPTSPWLTSPKAEVREPLDSSITVDVAVVGAGIAGMSTARHVSDRGMSVAVLERDRIAGGVTGRSTAKLTSQHGLIYDHLRREFGRDAARQYASSNERVIDDVERLIVELGIEAETGFERKPAYVYGNDLDPIEREVDAARAAGLDATLVRSVPPFERATAAVRFDDQACFHPRAYLLALADELETADGAAVYEGTPVTDVETGSPCRLRTAGGTVTADRVVLATGFPILDRAAFFTRLYPKRSYVLGIEIRGDHPSGMYYRHGDPYRTVRSHRTESGRLLLVGGENHKTGQGGSTVDRYRRLLDWASERFDVTDVAYRWSTQDYVPVDRVPFVGRAFPGTESVYVATGFRGWGMTNGVVAGRLLAAHIDGERPLELDLFDPLRFKPKPALSDALTENADAASQFATDWLRTLLGDDSGSIDPGEGRVIRRGASPVAVARDRDGTRHVVSAVCTHTYCIVEWNDAECSWDCPCHGSRFEPDGRVLEGPATDDLPPREPPDR